MTDQPLGDHIKAALESLQGKHYPDTVLEAFTVASLLDMCASGYELSPPELCVQLRTGLKAFLFRHLGSPQAAFLAERSWAATDIIEALMDETERMFGSEHTDHF